MSIRDDITIAWDKDPRIINIAYPSAALSVQDMVDTLRVLEYTPDPGWDVFSYPYLVSAAGKEDIGGGVLVGITASLNNAQIAFAARTTSISAGSSTTGDVNGTILIDSAATFESDGVQAGDVIINFTDGSVTTIISVDSQIQVTHEVLTDGTNNYWTITDTYKIWPWEICELEGGNVVAADENDVQIDALLPRFGVSYVRTSSSSATLQEIAAIEYASFGGGVSIDVVNGYDGVGGPGNPIGNIQYPSKNIPDALAIAATRGFIKFFLVSSLTIDGSSNFAGMSIEGSSHLNTLVTIEDSADVEDINLFNCNITGIMDGGIDIVFCVVETLTYMHGHIHDSSLNGIVTLGGSEDAWIGNCSQLDVGVIPVINMGGSGQDLIMPNYSGDIKIANLTGSNKAKFDRLYGNVILDTATVTGGTIEVGGNGYLKDELGNTISSGTWNGVTIVNNLSNDKIDNILSMAEFLKDMTGGRWKRDGIQMIFYKADNKTEIARFNLFKFDGTPSAEDDTEVAERVRVTTSTTTSTTTTL